MSTLLQLSAISDLPLHNFTPVTNSAQELIDSFNNMSCEITYNDNNILQSKKVPIKNLMEPIIQYFETKINSGYVKLNGENRPIITDSALSILANGILLSSDQNIISVINNQDNKISCTATTALWN